MNGVPGPYDYVYMSGPVSVPKLTWRKVVDEADGMGVRLTRQQVINVIDSIDDSRFYSRVMDMFRDSVRSRIAAEVRSRPGKDVTEAEDAG